MSKNFFGVNEKNSVPCRSLLFDQASFFDTDIAVDSFNPCVKSCDEEFGTIPPSKNRQYSQGLSVSCFSSRVKNEGNSNIEASSHAKVNAHDSNYGNDEEFGTIPSKTRQYNQGLSESYFSSRTKNEEESNSEASSHTKVSPIAHYPSYENDSPFDDFRSQSPPLLDRPVKSFGRGRGLKKIVARPGFECF